MRFFYNHDKYNVAYNNVSCNRYGLYLIDRPNIPTAEKRIEEYSILGRNGKMYCDTGFVEDKEIPIKIGFFGNKNEWLSKYRAIKEWLNTPKSGLLPFNTIQFSDDTQYYYRVKKITLDTTEREACDIGTVEIRLTLDGYNYLRQGFNYQDFPINDYFESVLLEWSPRIKIVRGGDGTPNEDVVFTIENGELKNGVFLPKASFTITVGLNETVDIDMETPLVTCENTYTGEVIEAFNRVTGDFDTLTTRGVLKITTNVEVTGAEVKIMPLYKEL